MKFTTHLASLYTSFPAEETKWINANGFIFQQARAHGLALAGSIAMTLAYKKQAKKLPSDIDLVAATSEDALSFINSLHHKLRNYHSHWRLYSNRDNEYVPEGAVTHFRFQSNLWLPICIMVVPEESFKWWLTAGGIRVQQNNIVVKAAEELTKRDGKPLCRQCGSTRP